MIAEIIGAGLGLIGSLFGGKKKQETTSRVDYARMVQDAEAAGFNPLTAIRNGGSAGFTTTSTPGLSSSALVGQALGQVGNFIANFDPMADEKKELEYNLVQAQLQNLQANTESTLKQTSMIGAVPTWHASQREQRPSGQAAQVSARAAEAMAIGSPPSGGQTTVTNPWPVGSGFPVNPGLRDASAWEERYGEPGDWLGGIGTMAGDALSWLRSGQLALMRKTDAARSKPYRGPADPYDQRMYIPPALYGGPSYR